MVSLSQNEAPPILENPFFHRGPIRDRQYFFGRRQETRQALQMLRKGQCVSIVGPRRVGKTSLLFHLGDPEVRHQYGLGEEYILVYIDCQGWRQLDIPHVYQWIWDETRGALSVRGRTDGWIEGVPELRVQVADKDLATRTPETRLLPGLRQILTTRFDEGELRTLCHELGVRYDALPSEGTGNKARELIEYLWRRGAILELVRVGKRLRPDVPWDDALERTVGTSSVAQAHSHDWLSSDFNGFRSVLTQVRERGYKLVLLFDEFDTVTGNPNLDSGLFSNLRSLVPDTVYTTASHSSLFDLTYANESVLSSPFFNVFGEVCLDFFTPGDAEEMVSGLLKVAGQENLFTEHEMNFVLRMGGCHPFFLQLACYHLFEHKLSHRELEGTDYEDIRQRYGESAEAHFRYAWDHLGDDQRKLLRMIAEGEVSQGDDLRRRQLQRKCIIRGDVFFSPVFADFVRGPRAQETRVIEKPGADLKDARSRWLPSLAQLASSIFKFAGSVWHRPSE